MTRLWHRSGRLQSRMREWKRRKKVLSFKKGDIAVIDFKGTVDGKAFEGGEGKTYPLGNRLKELYPGV